MTRWMGRVKNAEVSFQFDCRFPLALLVCEATAGDAVNVVRFEFRRFVERRNLLSCSVVIFFVQQNDAIVSHNKVVRSNFALFFGVRF